MEKLLKWEKSYLDKGLTLVCGVDEAGRGPLAGPVSATALIPSFKKMIKGINDSKLLSDKKRRELYPQIIENAVCYKTVFVSHSDIDKLNILGATKKAMKDAISHLLPVPHIVLIDAVKLELSLPMETLIHGDQLSYSIAAASIVAKVERDNLMMKYAEKYPEYGFESHKGYCTKHHIEMLKKYGPCSIHRESFIKKFI